MEKCDICENEATNHCSKCGKPLCNEHITHGISMRTNDPTTDCQACSKKVNKMMRMLAMVLGTGLIIAIVLIVIYLNSLGII